MTRSATPSSPTALLTEAHRALAAGELESAATAVTAALHATPDWAPAVHLAGLVARAQGELSRAEDLMRRSLDLPGVNRQMRAEYANNLGNLLRSSGYLAQAEAVFRLALDNFDLAQARVGLARTLLEMDQADEALTVLRAAKPGVGGIHGTVLLSEALAQTGERQAALDVLTQAGEQDASRSPFWLALGARLASVGRVVEAEAALRPLLAGKDAPSALIALTDLRVLQRNWLEALTFLREGVRSFPRNADLHTRLAELEWMMGEKQFFADQLRQAVTAHPQDRALRLALIGSLANAGFADESEQLARAGLAAHPGDYHFAALLATRCAETTRSAEALALISTALESGGELEFVREQAAIVALVTERIEDALAHTAWLVDRRPSGQFAWALRTLALRMAGDDAWRAIADPARMCRNTRLQAPPGYADIAEFNQALAARLRARHTLSAHPLVNSVRDGTQIEIHPGSETDPLLRAFFDMIRAPMAQLMNSMPADATHPMFRRKAGAYRLNGCWTVRLEGGAGHHVSHIHPRGWISSAYYVTVPKEITEHPQRAGWLSFGKPPYPIRGLQATGWVQPEVGRLALFPSYQWHGVESFPGRDERLTIAFDAVPIASRF